MLSERLASPLSSLLLALCVSFGITRLGEGTRYVVTEEPLQLYANLDSDGSHLLPPGTPRYHDHAFAEGHSRYIVYVNFKGAFKAREVVSKHTRLIDPIWAFQMDAFE